MNRAFSTICFALAFVVVSVMASPSFAGGRNLLTNPGFEDGGGSYNGWFTFGTGPNIDNVIFRSGAASAKIFGEFTACPVPVFDVGGFGQTFTPIAGLVYKLSGYSYVSSGDIIPGTDTCASNRCIAQIAFFDAATGGNVIQRNEVVIGDGNTPLDQWLPFAVESPAPAGALRVEALVLFLQPGCDTGAVFIDDVSFCELEQVTEPNLIVNSSFDAMLAGWTTFGNVFFDGRAFAHHTTAGSAKLFGTFVPDNDSGMFQSFPATPGSWWRLDAWSMTTCEEDPISGTNDNIGLAKIVFRDITSAEIGATEITIIDNTAPLGKWRRSYVVANAPNGTVSVDAFILFVQQPTTLAGGAMWVDDISFQQLSSDPTGIPDDPSPLAFELYQNVPNPFNPSTRIDFVLEQADAVDISVYDVAGRRVVRLVQERLEAGPHSVTWDGKSANGVAVATGVYRYVMKTSTGQVSRNMVLMK